MKLSEIIKTNSWLSAEIIFLQLYPEEQLNISAYEKVYNDLKLLKPVVTDIIIKVSRVIDDYDNLEYIDVSGYYKDPQKLKNDLTQSLALEFTPWEEWLCMEIDKQSIFNFSELEILSYCLHEMTFFSFEQEESQEEFKKIKASADEIKNMSAEEKKEKLISLDELLKKYKNKENEF